MSDLLDLSNKIPTLKVEISAAELLETMRNITAEVIQHYEKKKSSENEYVSRKTAAAMCGCDLSSLFRWNRDGYLCAIKIGGKVRYKLSDIQRIIRGGSNA